jgi:hypothetical protein
MPRLFHKYEEKTPEFIVSTKSYDSKIKMNDSLLFFHIIARLVRNLSQRCNIWSILAGRKEGLSVCTHRCISALISSCRKCLLPKCFSSNPQKWKSLGAEYGQNIPQEKLSLAAFWDASSPLLPQFLGRGQTVKESTSDAMTNSELSASVGANTEP